MKQIPMTLFGAEKLREELEYLKGVRVPRLLPTSLTPASTAI